MLRLTNIVFIDREDSMRFLPARELEPQVANH